MSGGVDSSVAAMLMKNKGYEVIGITGLMHEGENNTSAIKKAAEVCDLLQIQHHIVDLRNEFKNNVIDYFENSYKKGLTPNPCTVCNRAIKWGALREYTQLSLNIDIYATGHYAKIIQEENNYKLTRAGDLKKDQIYFLFLI